MSAPKNTIPTNGHRSSKRRKPSVRDFLTLNLSILVVSATPGNVSQLKRIKEKRRALSLKTREEQRERRLKAREERRTHRSKEKKPWMVGTIIVLAGLVLLLLTIFLHEAFHPTKLKFLYDLLLVFFGHLGIAGMLLGAVTIIVEFKEWTEYFETRLANTIQKKEFLRTLEDDELRVLLRNVFSAIHKVDEFDRNSFHDFLTAKIQKYVGDPFREGTRSVMTVSLPPAGDCFIIEEDLRFTCRKGPAKAAKLQPAFKMVFDKIDLVSDFEKYRVSLCLPDQTPEGFCIPNDFKPFLNQAQDTIIFDSGETDGYKKLCMEKLLKVDKDRYGFSVSLEAFAALASLEIRQHVTYAIRSDRFLAWYTPYLSLGFEVIINYPADRLDLQVEHLGMDDAKLTIIKQPDDSANTETCGKDKGVVCNSGIYSLSYDSWLLPESGLVYRLSKKEKPAGSEITAQVTAGVKQTSSNGNEQTEGTGFHLDPQPPTVNTKPSLQSEAVQPRENLTI